MATIIINGTILRSEIASPKDVADIVAQDMAMAAKILQLANSALFGARRQVTNLPDAVMMLGMETVKDLALGLSVFSQFRGSGAIRVLVERLGGHSLAVGRLAHQIARSFQLTQPAAVDAFVFGLLHDVGKLVLMANCPEQYEKVLRMAQEQPLSVRAAEQEIFGTTHCEVGTYLAWLWGLPEAVTQVTALHHRPSEAPAETARLVTAVHVADAIVNGRADSEIDVEYLARMGWIEELKIWKTL